MVAAPNRFGWDGAAPGTSASRSPLSRHAPVLFVLVYPTAWVFVASFRTPETMFAPGHHIYTFDNYRAALFRIFTGDFQQPVSVHCERANSEDNSTM